MHRLADALGGDQEAGELQRIEVGLRQGHHHHHPAHVGHRGPLQQVAAGLEADHRSPPVPPVDGPDRHPIPHAHLLAALVQSAAPGAEQAPVAAGRRRRHRDTPGRNWPAGPPPDPGGSQAPSRSHQKPHALAGREGGRRHQLHPMALGAQPFAHHLLRLTAVQVDLQAGTRRQLLQGQAGPDEVERAGGAAQVERGDHGQPNRPPNRPLLW